MLRRLTKSLQRQQQQGSSKSNSRSKFIRHPWCTHLKQTAGLTDYDKILTFIAAHTASGNLTALNRDWAFLDDSEHAGAIEAILEMIVYAGVPRTINALTTLHSNYEITRKYVCDDTPTTVEKQKESIKKGESILKMVYTKKYDFYRKKISSIHPLIDEWFTEIAYGRIRSRNFTQEGKPITQRNRQLCILAAVSNYPAFPMFRSLITEALRLGATVDEVETILESTELIWGPKPQAVVDTLWNDLTKKKLYAVENEYKNSLIDSTVKQVEKDYHFPKPSYTTSGDTISANRILSKFRTVNDLPDWVRLTALLAAYTAAGNLTQVSRTWSSLPVEYHRAGLEAILISCIFAGWHKVINALEIIHKEVGILPESMVESKEELNRLSDPLLVRKNGEDLIKMIYKNSADQLRAHLHSIHPDLDNIILEWGYGRVLSRITPGIELAHKELWVIACLSGQIVLPQLHSHLRGALYNGASITQIRGILDQTGEVWGGDQQCVVDGYWFDFVSRLK